MGKKRNKRGRRQLRIPQSWNAFMTAVSLFLFGVFQVRLPNFYQDTGSACYLAAFCWYALLFVPVGTGMFYGVSAMVSARLARGSVRGAKKAVRAGVFAGAVWGLFFGVAGFCGADFLTAKLMGFAPAGLALQSLFPALFPLCVCLALAGGMDGFGAGQYAGLVMCVFGLSLCVSGPLLTVPRWEYGQMVAAFLQNEQYGSAFGAAGGAMAFSISAFVALAAAVFLWGSLQPSIKAIEGAEENLRESQGQLVRALFSRSLPVMGLSLLLTAGALGGVVLYMRSSEEGMLQEHARIFGIYCGKACVVLAVPVILALVLLSRAFGGLRTAYLGRNMKRAKEKCMVALRCVALLTVFFAAYLAVEAGPLMRAFFPEGDTGQAETFLRIGILSMVFWGLAAALAAILLSAEHNAALLTGAAVCTALYLTALSCMLAFLEPAVYAVLYANVIAAFLFCVVYFFLIQRKLKIRLSWVRIFLAPCMGGLCVAGVCALLGLVILKNVPAMVNALLCLLAGVCVYFVAVVLLKGATRRELTAFWGGEYLINLARRLRLM